MPKQQINKSQIQAQEAWIAPTLTNSWLNFGTPYATAGYMKDSLGFVHLKGLVKAGASSTSIFTLPVGYRPAEQHYFPGLSNDVICSMVVSPDGSVKPFGGSVSSWTTLSQITFKAEA